MMTKAVNRPDRSQKQRVPLGNRARMTVNTPLEEGYHYRIVNDTEGRLANALEGGYEFVHGKEKIGDDRVAEGSAMDSRISKPVGGGTTGYLMRISDEFYNEDQAAKEAGLAETEKMMAPENQRDVEEAYGDGVTNK